MKIAFIVDSFPKLSETFVLNQVTGLIDHGHDVQIFPTWRTSEPKVHPDVTNYGLLARTHAVPPTPRGRPMRLLSAFMILAGGFVAHPIRTTRLLRLVFAAPREYSLRAIYFLARFRGEFDVIHCHFGYNGIMALRLRKLGVKGFIGTVFHGHDMSQYLASRGPNAYKELFAGGDLFLPISDRWRAKLVELGCPADRTVVHRMGVDLEKFTFLPRSLAPGEKVRLLNVARLAPTKGHEFLLQAVARLRAAGRDISLVIAGDGPLAASLKEMAGKLGLGDVVQFLGPVSQDQVQTLMMKSHLLVQPSVTAPDGDQEGIPVVLMEAMATGMPVVATKHSGIPELVDDGKTGLLVPERDPNALADKLAYLIDNPGLWLLMGQAGRLKVAQFYNIRILNPQLIELYERHLRA
jgi:colanic acid/amylovoran biosynthesis glycosyltransferase